MRVELRESKGRVEYCLGLGTKRKSTKAQRHMLYVLRTVLLMIIMRMRWKEEEEEYPEEGKRGEWMTPSPPPSPGLFYERIKPR